MLKENEYRAACRGCHGGCVHILTVEDRKVVGIRRALKNIQSFFKM